MQVERMVKIRTALVVLMLWGVCPAEAYEFYVSADGSDSDGGTRSRPFGSLVRAKEAAAERIAEDGLSGRIVISIGGGNYSFDKTLVLDSKVCGGPGKSIVFRAVDGAKVVFSGGRVIDVSNAGLVSGAELLSRLNPAGRGEIYAVEINDSDMRSLLARDSAKLSMDGRMMNLARYPNVGYGHIDKIVDKGAVYAHGRTKGSPPPYSMEAPIGAVFTALDKDIGPWAEEFAEVKKAKVTGYLSYDWYKESHRIASIDDGGIKLVDYSRYGVLKKEKIPRRLVVSNLLCELDEAGEFYYDERSSVLFLWSFGDDIKNARLSLWAGVPFAEIKGASHITFENLTIEGVSQGKAVVYIKDSEDVRLAGCTIRNCSRPAVVIQGGKRCGILSCDIYDVPDHVSLSGGDVRRLIPAGHYAENCHFTQIQASDYYGRIRVRGVGQIFRNNLVHNFIGQVMTVGDNDHLIEYNEFFNIGVEEGDGGTIYSGAQMMSWGNVYRHNFLHHLMCVPQAHPRGGIYPDDSDQGDTITENLFYKAAHRAVLINGGAGHSVKRNIFLNGHIGIYNREVGCEKTYLDQARYDKGELKRGDKTDYIWKTERIIGKAGWNEEPWISRYPLFAKIMNKEKMRFWPIECDFSDNYFSGNFRDIEYRIAYGTGGTKDISEVEHIRSENNRAISMDVFEDASTLDFSYKSDETAEGLPDIQFERIGLYQDIYRTHPPNKSRYRKAVKDRFFERKSFDEEAKYDPRTISDLIYFNTGELLTRISQVIRDKTIGF